MAIINRLWGALPAFTLIGGLVTASAALGQSAASSANEGAGATTGLGTHHRFPTMAAAKQHCPSDTIVWSSGVSLTYHIASGDAGGASQGFYACKMEADSAGFHPVD